MNESFDFSLVPYTFGLCAAEGCPRAATCLRRCRKLPASLDLPATDSFKTRPCKQSFSANYESKPYKGHKRKM